MARGRTNCLKVTLGFLYGGIEGVRGHRFGKEAEEGTVDRVEDSDCKMTAKNLRYDMQMIHRKSIRMLKHSR